MKYLLDSNVLSEWWKPVPDEKVMALLERGGWLVPVPAIAEIQEGAQSNPSEARRIQINSRLDDFFRDFDGLVVV